MPRVIFLASRACELTHQNYSACAGRYARTFIGLANGWLADAAITASADDISDHLSEVSSTETFSIPGTVYEELFAVTDRLAVSSVQWSGSSERFVCLVAPAGRAQAPISRVLG